MPRASARCSGCLAGTSTDETAPSLVMRGARAMYLPARRKHVGCSGRAIGVCLDRAPRSHGTGFGLQFVMMKFAAAVMDVAALTYASRTGWVRHTNRQQQNYSTGGKHQFRHNRISLSLECNGARDQRKAEGSPSSSHAAPLDTPKSAGRTKLYRKI